MTGHRSFLTAALLLLAIGPVGTIHADTSITTDQREHQTGVALLFGFPDFFSIALSRPVSSRGLEVGYGLGYLPLGPFLPAQVSTPYGTVMDGYTVAVTPKGYAGSSSVFLRFRFSETPIFVQSSFALLVGSVGGLAVLRNDTAGKSIALANLDVYLFQPTLGLSVGSALWTSSKTSLEVTVGLAYLFPATLHSSVTGNGPAFLEVVPEWRDRITDSIPQAAAEITQLLNDAWLSRRLLPSFSLRMAW